MMDVPGLRTHGLHTQRERWGQSEVKPRNPLPVSDERGCGPCLSNNYSWRLSSVSSVVGLFSRPSLLRSRQHAIAKDGIRRNEMTASPRHHLLTILVTISHSWPSLITLIKGTMRLHIGYSRRGDHDGQGPTIDQESVRLETQGEIRSTL